jgi:Amt family ammonium transporter
MYFGTKFLESKHLDDVVGAIPVHMFAGIFGTLVVPISNPDYNFWNSVYWVLLLFAYLVLYFHTYCLERLKHQLDLELVLQAEKLGTDVA